MFKRSLLLALLLLPAVAVAPAHADTRLRLDAQGEARAPADRMQAQLMLERRAATAEAANAALAELLGAALAAGEGAATEAAEPILTIHPETGEAIARQALTVGAAADEAGLALLAALGAAGASLERVEWRLSTAGEAAAGRDATASAIRALRERAGQVATELGLRVAALNHLSVAATAPPRNALVTRGAPARAPEIVVTVEVTGELLLRR